MSHLPRVDPSVSPGQQLSRSVSYSRLHAVQTSHLTLHVYRCALASAIPGYTEPHGILGHSRRPDRMAALAAAREQLSALIHASSLLAIYYA